LAHRRQSIAAARERRRRLHARLRRRRRRGDRGASGRARRDGAPARSPRDPGSRARAAGRRRGRDVARDRRAAGGAVRRPRRERGAVALATALAVLLIAMLLGAAVADVARIELVLAQSRRTLARGLAAAEACLARVTATLPAGWDQTSTLAGPDGIGGTADDG